MIRSKEEKVDSVSSLTSASNSTYHEILASAQSSKDLIDNVKITAAAPAVIKKAIKKSKNKISNPSPRAVCAMSLARPQRQLETFGPSARTTYPASAHTT